MKPTPLHPLRPSRRLMREYQTIHQWAGIFRALTGWAAVVVIAVMLAVAAVPV